MNLQDRAGQGVPSVRYVYIALCRCTEWHEEAYQQYVDSPSLRNERFPLSGNKIPLEVCLAKMIKELIMIRACFGDEVKQL